MLGPFEIARRLRRIGLVGIGERNARYVLMHNPRKFYPRVDDKLITKQLAMAAGLPVPELYAVIREEHEIGELHEKLKGRDQFVVKPAHGSGGAGIVVVGERVTGGWRRAGGGKVTLRDLHRHLADIVFGAYSGDLTDRAFVEERIVPHQTFVELWADGLCDLRVITLRGTPVMAMVRVPTLQSGGRANLHQGGLGLAVDLATGHTVRAVHRGRSVTHHPESNAPLVGLALPAWDQVLEVARAAAGGVPLGYLGVDIVVDRERGPLVLEINARPGLEIQNVHGRGLAAAIAEVGA